MKKEFSYEVKTFDPPDDWIVVKTEIGNPENETTYKVGLRHHEDGQHHCSCKYLECQKWTQGQMLKYCKHIEYVLDEEYRRKNS